jgi:hypothetical protein
MISSLNKANTQTSLRTLVIQIAHYYIVRAVRLQHWWLAIGIHSMLILGNWSMLCLIQYSAIGILIQEERSSKGSFPTSIIRTILSTQGIISTENSNV